MAGPGDERAARTGGSGRLRASHADREQVIGTLKAAFVQGMLDKDEFDLRVDQAFVSRTYADLAVVTADIPAGLAALPPLASARAQGQQSVLRPGPVIMAATVFFAGVYFAILTAAPDDNNAAGFLFSMTSLTYLLILTIAGANMLALRREKRSGGKLPRRPGPAGGGQGSQRRLSAGQAGQLPPAGHGQQHTAEAARSRPDRRYRRSVSPFHPAIPRA
jgi:hypothetical protein